MIGKYFYGMLAVAVLIASATVTASAQVAELRGKVIMQQADGQNVPLAKLKSTSTELISRASTKTKTNKKGEFVFAGCH